MTNPRTTPSVELKVAEAKAGLFSRIFFGIFCILTGLAGAGIGFWLDFKAGQIGVKETTIWSGPHLLMAGGMIWAIFGGMLLPSVFESAKPVITFFLPNGIPFVGGRRSTDPPAPPTPPQEPPANG